MIRIQANWNRLTSLLVAIAILTIFSMGGGGEAFLRMAIYLMLPMACIWFSEAMGSIANGTFGVFSKVPITQTTPGPIMVIAGWIGLVAPVIWLIASSSQ